MLKDHRKPREHAHVSYYQFRACGTGARNNSTHTALWSPIHQPLNQAMVLIPMGLSLKHSLKGIKNEEGVVVGITGQGSLKLSAIEVPIITHVPAYLQTH